MPPVSLETAEISISAFDILKIVLMTTRRYLPDQVKFTWYRNGGTSTVNPNACKWKSPHMRVGYQIVPV